jgi:HAE1 family hydrophobic/amphiphilic exporter-1
MLTPQELYEKTIQKTETGSQKMTDIEHKMETQYERTLKEAVRSWKARVSIICVMFAIFILSLIFIPKTEFFPQSLQTHYEINIKFPQATSLAYTEERCKKIEAFLKTLPDIKSRHLHLKPAAGTFIIEFSNIKRAPKRLSAIRHHLEQAPDIYFNVIALTPLSAIVEGIETRAIDFKVKGPDLKNLNQIAARFAGLLKGLRGVISVSEPEKEGKPEMNIVVDREKAADLALTSKAIADNLKHQLYGTEATDISIDGEEIPVTIRSQTAAPDTRHDLQNLLIPSPFGPHVPLETLAEFKETFVPTVLPREEKERTLTVTAILDPAVSPQEIIQRVGLKTQRLAQSLHLTQDYSIQVGPQIKTLEKSLWDLKIAILSAIILIYLILAAQFESLIHPFTILFSVPLSLIGIVVSLRLTGQFLSLPAMIGIIILVGTSVSNAIILIDYINILRRRGIDREEAILEAGKRRLRPILMTAITTVTGILPMAFGFGAGTELYQPLAIVIVGGLISSTPLTLLFIPTVYCFFDDLGDILGLSLLKLQMKVSRKP